MKENQMGTLILIGIILIGGGLLADDSAMIPISIDDSENADE